MKGRGGGSRAAGKGGWGCSSAGSFESWCGLDCGRSWGAGDVAAAAAAGAGHFGGVWGLSGRGGDSVGTDSAIEGRRLHDI